MHRSMRLSVLALAAALAVSAATRPAAASEGSPCRTRCAAAATVCTLAAQGPMFCAGLLEGCLDGCSIAAT